MKYVADYFVSHLGNKHSGTVVLGGDGTPKVGDILDVRLAGRPMPIQIDSVNLTKEMYAYNIQTSPAPLTGSSQRAGPGWATIASLFVIVVFGVTLIGHLPKWPIYVTVLVWWAFVIYTTIHINHQKDASISGDQGPSRHMSQGQI